MKPFIALLVLTPLALPALGHHSDAGLDMDSTVPLEGTVVEYRWRNPHVYITINASDESGSDTEWNLQAGPIALMSRMGWSRDSITVGERISVGVHPARDGRPYGFLTSVRKEDGTEIPTSFDAITGEPDQPIAEPLEAATSLEGIWRVDSTNLVSYPGGSEGYFNARLELTEKARIARSYYDEESDQNPVASCIGLGDPYITVLATIFPLEIRFDEQQNTVSIRSGALDYRQTVFLDGRGHTQDGGRAIEGHAIGWWEEDTLVVDTRLFADHLDAYQMGVPSGPAKHVIQRYRLIDGGTRMEIAFTLEDPEYIATPLTDTRELIYSPQDEILPFDCDLESATQFLN
ncbi:MAG: DUF6152 family protein [Gammaproteobacteria bacterium]